VHWQKFKDLKRIMQRECRRSFNKYMFTTLHEPYLSGKKKKLFRYIKSLRSDRCGIDTLLKDGCYFTYNQAKSELLNTLFSSVFTTDDGSDLPVLDPSPYPDISPIEVSVSGITSLLNELDPTKSPGPDKIPSNLLKLLAYEVSPCFALLFSASLQQSIVPSDWKKASVCPIFKKGDQKNAANYRPVSLTSVCSKIMEHVVCSNVMSHLECHDILTHQQFGFHQGYSAELQLLQTIHDLILKQKHYGVRNSVLDWIQSFLVHSRLFVGVVVPVL